jgi:hypothetical protein
LRHHLTRSQSMAVRKPDDRLGTTLLQNLIEYDSLLPLFCLPTAPSPTASLVSYSSHSFMNMHRPSSAICERPLLASLTFVLPPPSTVSYGIQRCRELASDSRLGRMVWETSHQLDSVYPSDSELIMAAFLHSCDMRLAYGVRDHLRPDQGAFR